MKKCGRCKQLLPKTEFWKGYSVCKNCRKEYMKNYYYNSDKKLIINKRYKHSAKGRETSRRWQKAKYHANKGEYYKQYRMSEGGKLVILRAVKRYNKTKKGKETKRKIDAKRRGLKYIPMLDNPFPSEIPVDYHHINNILTIPLPEKTHLLTNGKNHRERCKFWIKKLYCLDLNRILGGI